jgi:hypothetical protein
MGFRVFIRSTLVSLALIGAPACGRAADLISRDTFSGVGVAGPIVASGERSWLDRGLGKLREGRGDAALAGDATLVWRPSFSERLGGLMTVQAQSRADPGVGVGEAYLVLRPSPTGAVRLSGRAGLFFPPISLEHDGSEWSLVHTLTPSAINSWVAEEVKTVGVEGKARGRLAGRDVALTLAAFKGNDTSGALLTFRGWAQHDLRSSLDGRFPLPPLATMFVGKQAPNSSSIDEVDGRWGGYARIEVEATSALRLSAFVYDNNGDPTAIRNGQYAWRTQFVQVAAQWRGASGLEVLGQALDGRTAMGRLDGGVRPARIGYASAFVLVSKPIRSAAVTGRLDYFAVSDRTFKATDNNAERGWSATAAWRQPVTERTALLFEGLAIQSHRPARQRLGEDASQTELQFRSAVRVEF